MMNTKQKLLFIFALVISNCFTYLLFFNPQEAIESRAPLIVREGYQKLKIRAIIKTPLEVGLPISLINASYKTIIKDVFFLGYPNELSQENLELEISETNEVTILVEVPKKDALFILKMGAIIIVPYDFSIPKAIKKVSHEINY